MSDMGKETMPLGLSFTMAMDEDAMVNFANMTEPEKNAVLEQAKNAQSKADMEKLVQNVAKGRVR